VNGEIAVNMEIREIFVSAADSFICFLKSSTKISLQIEKIYFRQGFESVPGTGVVTARFKVVMLMSKDCVAQEKHCLRAMYMKYDFFFRSLSKKKPWMKIQKKCNRKCKKKPRDLKRSTDKRRTTDEKRTTEMRRTCAK